jgi:murein DD-endopeptidase MepM/ murein hydrolase activator NlpD
VPTAEPLRKPAPPSLWRPSLKFAAGLIIVIALAGAVGTVVGLPSPIGSDTPISSAAANPTSVEPYDVNTLVGEGTGPILELGPFFPVLGKVDYGEGDARFGAMRSGHTHAGQDIFAAKGTPLVAVTDGVVSASASEDHPFSSGRGNYIAIYDRDAGRSYAYLHLLDPPSLRSGDKVEAGQVIGLMGCTGSCYGVHLHFEIRKGRATVRSDARAIDPLPFLKSLPQAPSP